MQPDSARSPCPSSAVRQSRDLSGALVRMAEQFADLEAQALVVTHAAAASPSRRRATDPGSPLPPGAGPSCSVPGSPLLQPAGRGRQRLAGSAGGSPTLLPNSMSSAVAGGARGRLPPLTADRLQQYRRSRSSSSVAAAASCRGKASGAQQAKQIAMDAASGAARSTGGDSTQEQPLDSYQRFAAQLFQERFCPLRLGLQQQHQPQPEQQEQLLKEQEEPPQQQPVQPQQERQATTVAAAPHLVHQLRQLAGSLDRQQQQQQQQQQLVQHPEGEEESVPETPPDEQYQQQAAVSAVYCSGGSLGSYVSEEGDKVLIASPNKALPVAAAQHLPASAGLRQAPSPLPHLSEALELLTAPPGPAAHLQAAGLPGSEPGSSSNDSSSTAAGAACHPVAAEQQAGLPCSPESAPNQHMLGPGGASPTDLRPLRLAFDQAASPDLLPSPPLPAAAAAPTAVVVAADLAAAEPGSSDAAAVARCLDASTAIPLAVEASSPPREPPAAGEPPGTLAGPAAGAPAADSRPSTAPQQPAALDTPAAAAPAVHVAVERPTTASSRAQALLRLKQRRLQQHLHEQQPGGGGASSTAVMPGSVQLGLPDAANAAAAADAVTSHPAPQQLAIHVEAASTVSGEHAEQGPAQQQQDQGGEQPARQPKPFLRRRSQMIPMQKLPDYGAVRPRTSSHWAPPPSSGSDTPGGSLSGTPVASLAGTPRLPQTAPPAQLQQPGGRPASSRIVGTAAGRRASSRLGVGCPGTADSMLGGLEPEVMTYTLPRTSSRGSAAAAAAAASRAAAQGTAKQPSQRQRWPWGAAGEQVPAPAAASRPRTAAKQQQQQQRSARTTPFAPRPNSREGPYWPLGESGTGTMGRPQSAGQSRRPRGTPLYDAASLLPLTLEGGHHAGLGGHSGGSTRDRGSRRRSGSGSGFRHEQSFQSGAGALLPHGGSGGSAAEAAAGASGPLDDLLSQVDRMLQTVERAIS